VRTDLAQNPEDGNSQNPDFRIGHLSAYATYLLSHWSLGKQNCAIPAVILGSFSLSEVHVLPLLLSFTPPAAPLLALGFFEFTLHARFLLSILCWIGSGAFFVFVSRLPGRSIHNDKSN
jgi:hypothetical protein